MNTVTGDLKESNDLRKWSDEELLDSVNLLLTNSLNEPLAPNEAIELVQQIVGELFIRNHLSPSPSCLH
ncbi:MAG: hypothetical protein GVY30_01030 [Chloroflexi bacterium]|jgi:hypothetical protein|nr:hypothetical protein [Chloroflexota bacterium]